MPAWTWLQSLPDANTCMVEMEIFFHDIQGTGREQDICNKNSNSASSVSHPQKMLNPKWIQLPDLTLLSYYYTWASYCKRPLLHGPFFRCSQAIPTWRHRLQLCLLKRKGLAVQSVQCWEWWYMKGQYNMHFQTSSWICQVPMLHAKSLNQYQYT